MIGFAVTAHTLWVVSLIIGVVGALATKASE